MPSRKRPSAMRTRCLAEVGSTCLSKLANSERFFSTDPAPAAPAISVNLACTSLTGSAALVPCTESFAATSPRSPSRPNSFATSPIGEQALRGQQLAARRVQVEPGDPIDLRKLLHLL